MTPVWTPAHTAAPSREARRHLHQPLLRLALAHGQAECGGVRQHVATHCSESSEGAGPGSHEEGRCDMRVYKCPAWGLQRSSPGFLGSATNMAPPEGSEMTWLVMSTATLYSSDICSSRARHNT